MDFIIGGSHQGKRNYIKEHYSYETVFEGKCSSLEDLEHAEVILDVHLLVRRLLEEGFTQEDISERMARLRAKVIVADEIGCGLVPVDKFERMYRETAGRQCCQIAKRADTVVRIVCGIPTVIKRTGMKLYLIRHGFTKGNEEKRYVGTTDESLSECGKEKLQGLARYFKEKQPDYIFVSPMKRCLETAEILFPDRTYQVVENFRECDFGQFEYKNYKELDGNEAYQRFIDSGGMTGFPEGELPETFRSRCQEAFREEMQKVLKCSEVKSIALVVLGGTIMSILDACSEPHKEYFSWQVSNGEGYCGELFIEEGKIKNLRIINHL